MAQRPNPGLIPASEKNLEPFLLPLVRELAALASTGLGFTQDPYDRERYQRISELATSLISAEFGLPATEVAIAIDAGPGYATPKIDVRGAVFRDGQILLVREVSDGKWALPGGYADVNLSPSQAIETEILQESGFEARAVKLVAVLDRRRHHQAHPLLLYCYKLFFLCELTGGAAATSLETTEIGFFPIDALPDLSLGRNTEAQIRLLDEHRSHPELPTVFD